MAFSSSSSRPATAGRLVALLAAAVIVPGLAACGDDVTTTASTATDAQTSTTAGAAPTTTSAAETGTCKTVSQPEPRSGEPDLPAPKPARLSGRWTVTMTTNCGSFTIRLDTKRQPKTTASFKSLVAAKFYDGLTFHRIVADYVIQGGDPAGDGTGGPGYSVEETPPADAAYTRGIVAMAKAPSEPNGTSGSQFYVVTGADTGLPPEYAIVGTVIAGMDTVDRIAAIGSGGPPNDVANAPVVISKATVAKG
ncbi:peptidylprolyl isomerase [Patulibacter sp. NPDC049589]|uniref:peptidylprolyl isomerase n=1 Tax=Patulibacter sp. NPDC049589 TaxID=3154731 RepID=UPI00343E5BF2